MLLLCLSRPLLLSLHVSVAAASPLSDDVPSEVYILENEKWKDLYYTWFLKYHDSLHSKTSLFSAYDTLFQTDLSAASIMQVISFIIIFNKPPCGLTTGSLGDTNIITIAVIL